MDSDDGVEQLGFIVRGPDDQLLSGWHDGWLAGDQNTVSELE